MDDSEREHLSERYDPAGWPPSSDGRITIPDAESLDLEGWEIVRARPLPVPNARTAWSGMFEEHDKDDHAVLRVDIIETSTAAEARDQLLALLGQFESPLVEQHRTGDLGDVAFGPPGGATVLFTRANVVAGLSNAERHIVPVAGVARLLDRELLARLELPMAR
ncbi:MAG TPA: hypothetical protein VEJ84_05095 [Acidimicrobiales bacterium]|nr:hypothetical protein [Acidimicrobiales bacterium]